MQFCTYTAAHVHGLPARVGDNPVAIRLAVATQTLHPVRVVNDEK